jgi:acyl-CoA reductase-like NAD-dependent aldehyde dehydrogenase
MKEFNLMINGRLTPGALSMDVINPATGEVLTTCPRADAKQLDIAVQAAKAAFPAWAKHSVSARRAKIMAIADGLEARMDELARLLTAEQGKPLREAPRRSCAFWPGWICPPKSCWTTTRRRSSSIGLRSE